ncbi:MAG: hypothetical protein GKS07_01950 [Nitrosopumilus sp.]|nr:MAG: hypothetical protein GKS07_01950 [Nitrosopumilus sp.]
MYYHSWQLLFLKDQIRGSISKIKTSALFSKKFDFQEYVKREKRTYTRYLEIMENRSKTYFNQIIGLLMMLDEPYSVDVRHIFHPNPDDDNSILKWDQWKKNKKYSKSIHRKSGLLIKDLEVIYRRLAFDANNLDPINKWNPFMSTIRRSKKRDLRGDALIAQDYFDALEMMALHIKEISGKTMLHVSDSNPWLNNGWKEMKYGKPYDIKSEKTKKQILSDFLKSRPVTTSIIVEGKTEEKVTRKIMKQVYVENPEKQGIHIYNIRGSGNLTQRNIDGYITRANLEENEIYIILDQDAKKYIKKHAGKTIKKENTTVWEKDFEEDNFGISIVIKKANSLLKKYNKESITEEEVIQACKK